MITEIGEITHYLNDPNADLKMSITQIRELTETLNRETGPTLTGTREAIANVDKMIASFAAPDAELQQAIKNIETLTAALDEKIPPLIEEVDVAVANADKLFESADTLVADLQKLLDETAPDVPPMLSTGRNAVEKTDEMVDSVRSLWPLRKALPPSGEKTLRPGHDNP
jgi:ABC-type transporter Mla subunit MlaD